MFSANLNEFPRISLPTVKVVFACDSSAVYGEFGDANSGIRICRIGMVEALGVVQLEFTEPPLKNYERIGVSWQQGTFGGQSPTVGL
jgi:hypothetical protein